MKRTICSTQYATHYSIIFNVCTVVVSLQCRLNFSRALAILKRSHMQS